MSSCLALSIRDLNDSRASLYGINLSRQDFDVAIGVDNPTKIPGAPQGFAGMGADITSTADYQDGRTALAHDISRYRYTRANIGILPVSMGSSK